MNVTSTVREQWFNEIQFGNIGAVLFIVTYIGFYGFGIIIYFGQQIKDSQRNRYDLPAFFLKTLWDVPKELSDVERLKRIFRGYFADHETYITIKNDQLQAIVDERAYACALKYQEKLRRLHLSHTDYYSDTIPRLSYGGNYVQEQFLKSMTVTHTTIDYSSREVYDNQILSISVV